LARFRRPARRRLRKEALALAKLSHPNIETIYELGSHEGIDFLVTEFVAATTLADRIATGPLPESELLEIAMQKIASALEDAASNGLVHLDLKPRNMMLTPKGQVKLGSALPNPAWARRWRSTGAAAVVPDSL
jgi:serine/threonine-protein kinase